MSGVADHSISLERMQGLAKQCVRDVSASDPSAVLLFHIHG